MSRTVLILISTLVAGCSSDQTYRSLQNMEQSRCAEGPASEYQKCLQNAGMSYEEYEARRREEALENQLDDAPVAATVTGAASPNQVILLPPARANLQDTHWSLLQIGGTSVPSSDKAKAAHLVLDSATSRAHGSGGCNRFFAQYQSTGEALSFSAVGSTMMACPEGMDTEQAFFSALGQTERAQITGRILELYGPEGLLARLEAVYSD